MYITIVIKLNSRLLSMEYIKLWNVRLKIIRIGDFESLNVSNSSENSSTSDVLFYT